MPSANYWCAINANPIGLILRGIISDATATYNFTINIITTNIFIDNIHAATGDTVLIDKLISITNIINIIIPINILTTINNNSTYLVSVLPPML